MLSRFSSISLLIVLFLGGQSAAWAQLSVDEETANEVDITGGMADRSAGYAAQCLGRISPSRAAQQNQMNLAGSASSYDNTQQMPVCQQEVMSGSVSQNQFYGQAPVQQFQSNYSPVGAMPQNANPLAGFGVSSQQVAGVVGAAAVMHLMTNGGLKSLMGGLRLPINGGGFHTYGSRL